MKLDEMILKELDRQRIRSNIISIIMQKLNNEMIKNQFLEFMIDNRTLLLNESDLFNFFMEKKKS